MEKEGYFNFQMNLFAQIILTSVLFCLGKKKKKKTYEFIDTDF